MSRRGKRAHKTGTIVMQILIAMPILSILMALALAKLILSETIRQDQQLIGVCVIAGVIAFMLCLYCAIRMPQKKAIWGFATAGSYALALLLGNLLFFGVGYGRITPILITIILTGIVGSLIGSGKRKKYA